MRTRQGASAAAGASGGPEWRRATQPLAWAARADNRVRPPAHPPPLVRAARGAPAALTDPGRTGTCAPAHVNGALAQVPSAHVRAQSGAPPACCSDAARDAASPPALPRGVAAARLGPAARRGRARALAVERAALRLAGLAWGRRGRCCGCAARAAPASQGAAVKGLPGRSTGRGRQGRARGAAALGALATKLVPHDSKLKAPHDSKVRTHAGQRGANIFRLQEAGALNRGGVPRSANARASRVGRALGPPAASALFAGRRVHGCMGVCFNKVCPGGGGLRLFGGSGFLARRRGMGCGCAGVMRAGPGPRPNVQFPKCQPHLMPGM